VNIVTVDTATQCSLTTGDDHSYATVSPRVAPAVCHQHNTVLCDSSTQCSVTDNVEYVDQYVIDITTLDALQKNIFVSNNRIKELEAHLSLASNKIDTLLAEINALHDQLNQPPVFNASIMSVNDL